MSDQQQQAEDMNRQVIEDFRANGGAVDNAVGGFFRGRPVLILHHTGAKTGQERLNPLELPGLSRSSGFRAAMTPHSRMSRSSSMPAGWARCCRSASP